MIFLTIYIYIHIHIVFICFLSEFSKISSEPKRKINNQLNSIDRNMKLYIREEAKVFTKKAFSKMYKNRTRISLYECIILLLSS